MFAILAFAEDRLVIEVAVKLAVKHYSLLPDCLYMLAIIDDSVVYYAAAPNMFCILVLVEDRFVIYTVVEIDVKNDALLPDRLYIGALIDNSIV